MEMSQQELGRKIGRTRQSISRWESGANRPPSTVIGLIANALGVPEDDLIEK